MDEILINSQEIVPLGKKFPAYTVSQSEYKRLNSEESAVAWAKKYYGDWSQQYCNIYGHSSFTGGTIKNYIEYYTENLKNYNDVLSTLILHSPRLQENIVTYRCVSDVEIQNILQANKEERTFSDNGFMSTSLVNSTSLNNEKFKTDSILEIFIDKGTACVYTNLIKGCHRDEFELLILRNATMYLIDYPYKKDGKTFYPIRLKNIPEQNYLW